MKKLFTLIAALLMLSASAETLSLYEHESESYFVPINSMWFDTPGNKTQVLYPAADLIDMVNKKITAITFYTDEDGVKMDGGTLDLYMGETDVTALTGYIDGLTKVGTVSISASAETELTLTFDTPYLYQGGNLVFGNVVTAAGNMTMTYFGGEAVNYNSGVYVGNMNGNTEFKQFLPKTTFTYEGGGEEPGDGVTTLGHANALEDNAAFTFNGDAVVTYCLTGNNNIVYLFLRDESGYGMIANVDATFESGKVLSQGWNATKTSVNNGWVRFTNAENLNASNETNAELAAPQKLTSFPDESMLNAYVLIEKTTISSGGGGGFPGFPGHAVKYTLPDGSTISETQTLWAFDGEAGSDLYNVYGIVCKESNTLKIQPVIFEKYVEPQPEGLRGDVNDDKKVDIDDATMLINYLLGEPLEINQDNANCDLEGGVDIGDATALINYLLNSTWDN